MCCWMRGFQNDGKLLTHTKQPSNDLCALRSLKWCQTLIVFRQWLTCFVVCLFLGFWAGGSGGHKLTEHYMS